MDCRSAEKLIPSLLDRSLSPDDSALLEQHLSSCQHCSREAASLTSALDALDAWPTSQPRRTFADFKALADAARPPRRQIWAPAGTLFGAKWASAALVIVAFAAGGLTGAYQASLVPEHSHVFTEQQSLAAEALDLDVFGDDLGHAVLASASIEEETLR